MKKCIQRMFPFDGCDPSKVELWDLGTRYEVRRNGRRIWQSNFYTATCYARAYERYTEELSK